ncbi:unnamed protein product [Rotaria sp. Silwood1]|nr:unnamed protein product [Rotaria sp. Silwood1]CAF4808410.1 unnamed protein product [Rotaria sp. Silwood1]
MLLFTLLLLLLNIPLEIFGIYCIYSEGSSEWSLDDLNNDIFKEKVDKYPVYDYNDDNVDMCRVEIYVDYKSRLLIISFGDSFQWSKLDHGEGRLDFLIMFNQDNITQADYYNVLEYACYDQDECNKLFVYHHIDWLININYTQFETNLRSILFQDFNHTEYCFIDKAKLSKCSTGVCSGKYSSYHKNYLFECHKNSEALIEVHITINMILIEENLLNKINIGEDKIIRYTCKYNQCNNQLLTDKLIDIIQQDFQLSFMKNAFFNYYSININKSNYLSYETTYHTQIKQYSLLIPINYDFFINNIANYHYHYHYHLSIFIILTLLIIFINYIYLF